MSTHDNGASRGEIDAMFLELRARDVPEVDVYEKVLSRALGLSGSVEDLVGKGQGMARLYFELLRSCPSVYRSSSEADVPSCEAPRDIDCIPEETQRKLLTLFRNISQLVHEEDFESHGLGGTYIHVIWFLKSLRDTRDVGGFAGNHDLLDATSSYLLGTLGEIDYVFDMRDDAGTVFPIRSMLFDFVKEVFSQSSLPHILPKHIHILQLAIRFFESSEERDLLDKIVKESKLQFVSFMRCQARIVDTRNLKNFRENGVLVFWDEPGHRILVRCEDEEYFSFEGEDSLMPRFAQEVTVRKEVDQRGNEVCAFVTFDLPEGAFPMNVEELVEQEGGTKTLLRLLYDWKARNILVNHSLVKMPDGEVLPVNPWCVGDRRIVWENASREGSVDAAELMDAYAQYRLLPAAVDESLPLNRVTLGLCMRLLSEGGITFDDLGLELLDRNSWFQSQVLSNWATRCSDTQSARRVLGAWCEQIEYRAEGKRFKQKFEDKPFAAMDFLPLRHDAPKLLAVLAKDVPAYCGRIDFDGFEILRGHLYEDDNSGKVLVAEPKSTHSDGDHALPQREQVLVTRLEDPDEIAEGFELGDEMYVVRSSSSSTEGFIANQSLSKLLYEINRANDGAYSLDYAVGRRVTKACYDEIMQRIGLFADAFAEQANGCYACGRVGLDSVLNLRLIHNMLWAEVSGETVNHYVQIILAHQVLDFKCVLPESGFGVPEGGTLLVPKDNRESDSVLRSVVGNSRSASSRGNDLYDCGRLELVDEGDGHPRYRIDGQSVPVARVVFVTDNILAGAATSRAIRAYFTASSSIDDRTKSGRLLENARRRVMRYVDGDGKEVHLNELMTTNDIDSLDVLACYAADQGVQAVRESINDGGVVPLGCIEALASVNVSDKDTLESLVRDVWPKRAGKVPPYLVIRRYNMPKQCVFPDAMLNNPKRLICLFVRKEELS